MRSAIVVLGVIVALAGLLFAMQGFGAVSGSAMSNTTTWSILGPIIALIGIAIAFAGWRGASRKAQAELRRASAPALMWRCYGEPSSWAACLSSRYRQRGAGIRREQFRMKATALLRFGLPLLLLLDPSPLPEALLVAMKLPRYLPSSPGRKLDMGTV